MRIPTRFPHEASEPYVLRFIRQNLGIWYFSVSVPLNIAYAYFIAVFGFQQSFRTLGQSA